MSVYLVIQGRLKENGTEIYEQYLQHVAPLMQEYQVEIIAVGSGIASAFSTENFPINALLGFKDEETLEKFLGDARYLDIKQKFRDPAYAELHLSVFRGCEPRKFN